MKFICYWLTLEKKPRRVPLNDRHSHNSYADTVYDVHRISHGQSMQSCVIYQHTTINYMYLYLSTEISRHLYKRGWTFPWLWGWCEWLRMMRTFPDLHRCSPTPLNSPPLSHCKLLGAPKLKRYLSTWMQLPGMTYSWVVPSIKNRLKTSRTDKTSLGDCGVPRFTKSHWMRCIGSGLDTGISGVALSKITFSCFLLFMESWMFLWNIPMYVAFIFLWIITWFCRLVMPIYFSIRLHRCMKWFFHHQSEVWFVLCQRILNFGHLQPVVVLMDSSIRDGVPLSPWAGCTPLGKLN